MPRFEGRVVFGEAVLAVQDEQLMVYFPDGEGTSVPLTQGVVKRLQSFALMAQLALPGEQVIEVEDLPT